MILKILEDSLRGLYSKDLIYSTFFDFNDIILVPVVNVDAFKLISNSYGTKWWTVAKEIRKNLNFRNHACLLPTMAGVDLNRNYINHFGDNKKSRGSSSNPCNEEYRGPKAFSERETRAIRRLVRRNKGIVSSMNFHSYGDLWVHPSNYASGTNPI